MFMVVLGAALENKEVNARGAWTFVLKDGCSKCHGGPHAWERGVNVYRGR
jgi:hypothetical protein